MKTRIFYTTNAGLYFCSDSAEILVDGIHDAGAVGFHPFHEEMRKQMRSEKGLFVDSGVLLFTHLHKDHYDEVAVREYIRKHPETGLWGPGLDTRGIRDIRTEGDTVHFNCGDMSITAYRTKHSGPRTLNVPHYSLLLQNEAAGESFLIAGDAVLEPELAERINQALKSSTNGVCAFVMAYQLAERKSKASMAALSPSRIFLIHQPGPEDDAYGKVSRIKSFAIRETSSGALVEEPEQMSWIK